MDDHTTNPGPVDGSVLYDQANHVSSAVWEGKVEHGSLRCIEHTSLLDQWVLTEQQIELVNKAGFEHLRLIPAISLDTPLISALVERWRRETNTFHMTVGEMTITLEDVAYLLGLPVDGKPVMDETKTSASCDSLCLKYLGKSPGCTSGGMVNLSWLKEAFSECPENASVEEIEFHTRAYILYLVGSTIFCTTTDNKVPVMYLQLLEDFDEAGKYAWGAAALAFLYSELGNASLRTQSAISGCLTLLQCWSYCRLNIGQRPNLLQIHECFPFVLRWKDKRNGPTSDRSVPFYRKALDSLDPSDVDWCPYETMSLTVVPENIRNQVILGRSKTMLICFDEVERHLPDRCLRQFGMPQGIPEPVQRWERKKQGGDVSVKMEPEVSERANRRLRRPISITPQFEQKMFATMRDIARDVDQVSTDGMDNKEINFLTRIRDLTRGWLRVHSGRSMQEGDEDELSHGSQQSPSLFRVADVDYQGVDN